MKELNLRELIKYKILPFNIYNEKGQVIMFTGDLLTPGKLIQLKSHDVLLYNENFENRTRLERENPLIRKRRFEEDEAKTLEYLFENSPSTITYSTPERQPIKKPEEYNLNSIFSKEIQTSLKARYKEILEGLEEKNYETSLNNFISLMNVLVEELDKNIKKITHLSQLKIFGDYEFCHPLNVALMSGFLAKTISSIHIDYKDVILSGLMHDIGKTRIDQDIAYKQTLYIPEQAEYEKHVIIGYKIIKEIFKLGNTIARPALEHHSLLDGSGYPRGIAANEISDISKYILICNFCDNLTSNRTAHHINNFNEAGKVLLSTGAQKLPVDILYSMVNKFMLNDNTDFDKMIG